MGYCVNQVPMEGNKYAIIMSLHLIKCYTYFNLKGKFTYTQHLSIELVLELVLTLFAEMLSHKAVNASEQWAWA